MLERRARAPRPCGPRSACPCPARQRSRGRAGAACTTPIADRPAPHGLEAEERAQQSRAARADSPAMPRTSPRRSVNVASPGSQRRRRRGRLAAARARAGTARPPRAPTIRLTMRRASRPPSRRRRRCGRRGAPRSGRRLASLLRGSARCRRSRGPARFSRREQREELLDVVAAEAARRLVEHEHAAADGERAGDLDELLRGDRQVADDGVGRDVVGARAAPARDARSRPSRPRSHEAAARRLHAEQDVLHRP